MVHETPKKPALKKTAAHTIACVAAADTWFQARSIIDVILVVAGCAMLVIHEDHDHSMATPWILIASGAGDAGIKIAGSLGKKIINR